MNYKIVLLLCLVGVGGFVIGWSLGTNTAPTEGVPARTVADYLHAVIEADRTFYTQHVVERMEAMLIVTASERWREEHSLPLPAQFLREASRSLHIRGAPFRYRLVSPWPINPSHAVESDEEKRALDQIVEYGEIVEGKVFLNQKPYFKAIYPDRAVSAACVSCHNAHPKSPKRDFKLNDVIGGLEILIPPRGPS